MVPSAYRSKRRSQPTSMNGTAVERRKLRMVRRAEPLSTQTKTKLNWRKLGDVGRRDEFFVPDDAPPHRRVFLRQITPMNNAGYGLGRATECGNNSAGCSPLLRR